MITKEETYKKAFENKEKRLSQKKNMITALKNSAYVTNPRLSEIDSELAKVGAKLVTTALSGNAKALDELKNRSKLLSAEKQDILSRAEVKEIQYECDICNDTGYVSGRICDCIKREAAKITAEWLSKEMPLKDCKFENFDLNYYKESGAKGENPRRRMTAILKLCKEYAIDFSPNASRNLLFIGRTGLGKTHLTLAIVSEIIEKGYMPIYGSAENLFTAVEEERFNNNGRGVYEAMLNCDLLVIDDLGTEMITSFTRSVLYNLVNTRIMSGKPTIINTNLSMKEIEEKYSERIASRFIGNYDWHEFLGNDVRQQKILNK